jgi:hypothetical protein
MMAMRKALSAGFTGGTVETGDREVRDGMTAVVEAQNLPTNTTGGEAEADRDRDSLAAPGALAPQGSNSSASKDGGDHPTLDSRLHNDRVAEYNRSRTAKRLDSASTATENTSPLASMYARDSSVHAPADSESDIDDVSRYGPNLWLDLSHWAKEHDELAPWQRALAYSIGDRLRNDQPPSAKQAKQGLIVIRAALDAGFSPQAGERHRQKIRAAVNRMMPTAGSMLRKDLLAAVAKEVGDAVSPDRIRMLVNAELRSEQEKGTLAVTQYAIRRNSSSTE